MGDRSRSVIVEQLVFLAAATFPGVGVDAPLASIDLAFFTGDLVVVGADELLAVRASFRHGCSPGCMGESF
jgi:hypothetical protein